MSKRRDQLRGVTARHVNKVDGAPGFAKFLRGLCLPNLKKVLVLTRHKGARQNGICIAKGNHSGQINILWRKPVGTQWLVVSVTANTEAEVACSIARECHKHYKQFQIENHFELKEEQGMKEVEADVPEMKLAQLPFSSVELGVTQETKGAEPKVEAEDNKPFKQDQLSGLEAAQALTPKQTRKKRQKKGVTPEFLEADFLPQEPKKLAAVLLQHCQFKNNGGQLRSQDEIEELALVCLAVGTILEAVAKQIPILN